MQSALLAPYIGVIMKKDIHPEYRDVVFSDASADFKFITRSTVVAKDTIELDGKTYPHVQVDISSESHPFFTGKMKFVDTAGRVEKFQNKFSKTMKEQKKSKAAAAEQAILDKAAADVERAAEKIAKAQAKEIEDAKRAKAKAAAEKKKAREEKKVADAKAAKAAKENPEKQETPKAQDTKAETEASNEAPIMETSPASETEAEKAEGTSEEVPAATAIEPLTQEEEAAHAAKAEAKEAPKA